MKKIVRSLTSFSQPEVDSAFSGATLLSKTSGIKVLVAPAHENQPMGKMLIIIPRRVGKAHDRNRIRRQIKDIFYSQSLYKVRATYIVLIYQQALTLSFDQLKAFFSKSITASEREQ